MRTMILCIAVTLLAGCVSSGTNTEAAPLPIRLINAEIAKGCEFTGVATGHVYNAFQYAAVNVSDARLKAANEALATGANSAVITETDVERPGHNVTVNMDAYRCE